jgi:hypothetical protein
MQLYLCSTYTPSNRSKGKLPFLRFTNAILIRRANGRSPGTFKQSNDLDLRFLKFLILCIEMYHGKSPTGYLFNLKVRQPCGVYVTRNNKTSLRQYTTLYCSNHTNSYTFRQSVRFRKVK